MAGQRYCIRNWRDPVAYVGHDSAVVFPIFFARSTESDDPYACLEGFSSFTWHGVQGGQQSDLHQHKDAEQYYYILSGTGEVLIDGQRYPVREGTVAYFPPQVDHQLFSDPENDFLEHLVITSPVDRGESKPCVINWRESLPQDKGHGDCIRWRLLSAFDSGDDTPACLLNTHFIGRQALVKGKASNRHKHAKFEQLYYVLKGRATMFIDDDVHRLAEGDVAYLPKDTYHRIMNEDYDGWLSYLVIS